MKSIRKLLALALVLVMLSALSITVFADNGTITITPPTGIPSSATTTYKIYKVFDAAGNGDSISYTLVSGKTTAPAGFSVDAAGNVTYSGTSTDDKLTAADIAAIAAYVTEDDLVETVTTTGTTPAVSSSLPNGYYYITTTTGTVVTINSTNPSVSVKDKNTPPGVDKEISDADSYDADGKKALAQVGTQVEFTATVTVGVGRVGYVFNDVMSAGLEYVADSLSIAGMTAGTDYTLTVNGQNITVTFADASIAALADDATIVITYKATVTSDALQDDPAHNTATISYGTDSQYTSEPVQTDVYNAKLTVIKEDNEKEPMEGAGFVLKNADGKYYKIENNVVSWVDTVADATEVFTAIDSTTGQATASFTGLSNGNYTLVENTVPTGYNKAEDYTFTIAANNYTAANLKQEATVTNNPGTELPSTGGIGTTLFYVIGTILFLGAGVVLVTKRRVRE